MTDNTAPSWQQLLDLVTQLDSGSYDSASITFGDVSVQFSRSGTFSAPVRTAPEPSVGADNDPVQNASAATSADPTGTIIFSPMIGVFYRSPSPGEPPFVEPGARVKSETIIGIIEVMKLMNPVSAGVEGTLTSFLVRDHEQVEYGQALAVVAEAGTP
ncbi:MAG: biotin/lipoyl-containing protein [Acidimicrobiales bacterium]